MRLVILVEVPAGAPADTDQQLRVAAYTRQGITITTPKGVKIDVDLIQVEDER